MADKPKPKEGPKITGSEVSDSYAIEQIVMLLGGLFIIGVIAMAIINFINGLGIDGAAGPLQEYFFRHVWPVWKMVAVVLSVPAAIGVVYNILMINKISSEENKIYNPIRTFDGPDVSGERPFQSKWEKIIKLANSPNGSDWRLAIIEADVMLEEVLRQEGYIGDTIGEMLKSPGKMTPTALQNAWEAHKVRNEITHTGSAFELNDRETKRVIMLFEKVFKEFEVI